jgi:hypothetical protein
MRLNIVPMLIAVPELAVAPFIKHLQEGDEHM